MHEPNRPHVLHGPTQAGPTEDSPDPTVPLNMRAGSGVLVRQFIGLRHGLLASTVAPEKIVLGEDVAVWACAVAEHGDGAGGGARGGEGRVGEAQG